MIRTVVNPDRREWDALLRRAADGNAEIEKRVGQIIEAVRTGGDDALRQLTFEIEGVKLTELAAGEAEFTRAAGLVSEPLKKAMEMAAANIRAFHEAQLPGEVDVQTMPGVRCVQRAVPLRRVGLYIPGGSAPLFSTVLMLGIPAAVAGCGEVVLCTPPNAEGSVAPEILYAAQLCGIDKVYKVGGAQAIAAMALSTRTIPKVDKIFGPGNRYVTAAKQILSVNDVAIDMPAGPSEVMVMADGTADPEFVAADLLSQAEHGADSQALLVTSSRAVADRAAVCVQEQLADLPRASVARKALDNSRIIVMDSIEEMVDFANAYAPEHLIVSMDDAWGVAEKVVTAGSVFIGNYTPESAGDYASGTNHTLPTAGWARSFSGVNTESFMRRITYQEITPDGLAALGDTIMTMARGEGLEAHSRGVEIRLKKL